MLCPLLLNRRSYTPAFTIAAYCSSGIIGEQISSSRSEAIPPLLTYCRSCLSAQLAYKRHFPAIDWLISYSLYADKLADWYNQNVSEDFTKMRAFAMSVLQEESELQEIVRLVGADALSYKDRLTLETAKSIREDYLHQNAFHEVDTFTSLEKQYKIMKLIYDFHRLSNAALEKGAEFSDIIKLPVREKIGRTKYIPEERISEIETVGKEISDALNGLVGGEEDEGI